MAFVMFTTSELILNEVTERQFIIIYLDKKSYYYMLQFFFNKLSPTYVDFISYVTDLFCNVCYISITRF